MNIRFALKQDFHGISIINQQIHSMHINQRPDLFSQGYQNSIDENYYNILLKGHNHRVIVVEEYDKIIGYAIAEIKNIPPNLLLKPRCYLMIDQIAVSKNHRRRRIGHLLMSFIEEIALKEKASSIELNVQSVNQVALAFYQSIGMEIQSYRLEKLINSNEVRQ